MNPIDTQNKDALEHNLQLIHALLEKHQLVENIVHHQEQPRGEIIELLVQRQHSFELKKRLSMIHIADVADLLEALPLRERQLVWAHLERSKSADVLMELSDPVREQLIGSTNQTELLRMLDYLDADDLAYIADDVPEAVLNQRLQSLTVEDKDWLRASMAYPEDSVGYLMSNELITVRCGKTLAEVQKQLREMKELPIHNDKLFVLNERGIFVGVISLKSILLNDPAAKVQAIMAQDIVNFHPEDKTSDAANAFERYDLVSAPVLNERGKVVGRLTVDLMMEYIREETSGDVINMAGLAEEEDLSAPIVSSAKNRGTWLLINLLSTFVAATIIGLFENTIMQIVALAALMPIVASVGGNSGNQTTALIIRGMALGKITNENMVRLLKKEISVSLLNGLMLGVIVGVFAFVLYQQILLSMVIAIAMLITLIIAAILGFSVPLLLQKAGRDPALGSSVLQTATTDSIAFLIFLGLATLFLL